MAGTRLRDSVRKLGLSASRVRRSMGCRTSGISDHWLDRAAASMRGGIRAAGRTEVLGALRIICSVICSVRRASSPESMAFLSHCSHSSSSTTDVSPASRRVARSRSRSFRCTPTLSNSSSLSSSLISSWSSTPMRLRIDVVDRTRSGPVCVMRAASGSWTSGGGTQSDTSSAVVSRMEIPCSFSNFSFAHFVPSHLVRPHISALVRRKASKARKRRLCHGHRQRRMRCVWWV